MSRKLHIEVLDPRTANGGKTITLEIVGIRREVGTADGGGNGSGSLTRQALAVTANGQTVFNIFSLPENAHSLEVNGVTYYPGIHYTVGTSGGNNQLTWLNSFPLTTIDKLFLVKA